MACMPLVYNTKPEHKYLIICVIIYKGCPPLIQLYHLLSKTFIKIWALDYSVGVRTLWTWWNGKKQWVMITSKKKIRRYCLKECAGKIPNFRCWGDKCIIKENDVILLEFLNWWYKFQSSGWLYFQSTFSYLSRLTLLNQIYSN